MQVTHENEIRALAARGALFVLNHSGGKDSQAMFLRVSQIVPASQIVVIHAELPGVEWEGILEHIRGTIGDAHLIVTRAVKTFFDMVDARRQWPSPKNRQCTSDLKRGPIEREVRRYAAAKGVKLIVNCMGLRAEESDKRASAVSFKLSTRNSKAGREWYDWLPIHHLLLADVFGTIAVAGQVPHWAYAAGMSRLSCCFCIMSSLADLKKAAELNPALYAKYVAKEKEIGHTMNMKGLGLETVTGIKARLPVLQ